MISLTVLLVVAACGDDGPEEQRRFANDPTNTPAPSQAAPSTDTSFSTPETDLPGVVSTPVAQDLATLLADAAALSTALFALDGQIVTVAPGQEPITLTTFDGAQVIDLSVSATGAPIALLLSSNQVSDGTPIPATPTTDVAPGATRLLVIGEDGAPLWQYDDLAATIAAQEATDEDVVPTAIAVSNDGSEVLVGLSDGHLLRLTADSAEIVTGSGGTGPITELAWSPDNTGVAFLTSLGEPESQALVYSRIRPDGVDPVRLAPSSDNSARSVGAFVWLPDSSGILYSDASGPLTNDSLALGRDLFVVYLDEPNRRLVAAAGAAAPVAGVFEFAPSADGEAVAFTVVVPGPNGPVFDSLWVQPLSGGLPFEIHVPVGTAVTDLRWTDQGLVWRTVGTGSIAEFPDAPTIGIAMASGDDAFTVLIDLAPAATPVATPHVATPEIP